MGYHDPVLSRVDLHDLPSQGEGYQVYSLFLLFAATGEDDDPQKAGCYQRS